jgi:hypothetical protein
MKLVCPRNVPWTRDGKRNPHRLDPTTREKQTSSSGCGLALPHLRSAVSALVVRRLAPREEFAVDETKS